jgi:hypothetical protein
MSQDEISSCVIRQGIGIGFIARQTERQKYSPTQTDCYFQIPKLFFLSLLIRKKVG